MSKSDLTMVVERLGLTKNEATVYLTSLSLGPASILDIARKAEMYRPTVYAVVEALKQKGLMHEEAYGLKTKFAAENPEKLETTVDQIREGFRGSLPELMALYNSRGGESSIKYYEGIRAIENLYNEMLRELKAKDEWWAISDTQRWYELDPAYFDKLIEKRAEKALSVRLILNDSPKAQEFRTYARNFSMEVKVVRENQDFKMSSLVTPEHVLLHTLTEPTSAILIKNQRVIDMQRQVFNLMWEALPD